MKSKTIFGRTAEFDNGFFMGLFSGLFIALIAIFFIEGKWTFFMSVSLIAICVGFIANHFDELKLDNQNISTTGEQ